MKKPALCGAGREGFGSAPGSAAHAAGLVGHAGDVFGHGRDQAGAIMGAATEIGQHGPFGGVAYGRGEGSSSGGDGELFPEVSSEGSCRDGGPPINARAGLPVPVTALAAAQHGRHHPPGAQGVGDIRRGRRIRRAFKLAVAKARMAQALPEKNFFRTGRRRIGGAAHGFPQIHIVSPLLVVRGRAEARHEGSIAHWARRLE